MSKTPHFTVKPLVRVAIAHAPEVVKKLIEAQADGKTLQPHQVDLLLRGGGHHIAWYEAEVANDLTLYLQGLGLQAVVE